MNSRKNLVDYFVVGLLSLLFIFFCIGCSSLSLAPRTALQGGELISDQPPRALIDLTCGAARGISDGVATCEVHSGEKASIFVKIMPVPGRVVFSDGLTKVPIDFNYRKGGWIWKETIIDRTWVPLDLGELVTIFGDVPVAFDVQGQSSDGVITNRGVLYTHVCDDKTEPCQRMNFDYDCGGKTRSTGPGQIGSCVRASGSSQKLRLPIIGEKYQLRVGAKISIQSPLEGWVYRHEVLPADVLAGEVVITYPAVLPGVDLLSLAVRQWEPTGLTEYHGQLLLVGFSPKWTGVDRPHQVPNADGSVDICIPFRADLLEISEGDKLQTLTAECLKWPRPRDQVCAFAFDRESGDQTYSCVKQGKEVRFPK